jgi:hypothetical protein
LYPKAFARTHTAIAQPPHNQNIAAKLGVLFGLLDF